MAIRDVVDEGRMMGGTSQLATFPAGNVRLYCTTGWLRQSSRSPSSRWKLCRRASGKQAAVTLAASSRGEPSCASLASSCVRSSSRFIQTVLHDDRIWSNCAHCSYSANCEIQNKGYNTCEKLERVCDNFVAATSGLTGQSCSNCAILNFLILINISHPFREDEVSSWCFLALGLPDNFSSMCSVVRFIAAGDG